MPKFITIGYGDEAGYDRTPEAVITTAHEYDARLQREGAITGIAGEPVQVRNPDATGVQVTKGPYLSASLPIAGFSLIEADSLEDAVKMAAGVPCAVAHGVVEVWPLTEAQ